VQSHGIGPVRRSSHSISAPILAGAACGLVVGAAVGLLLAPDDGRCTRRWISAQGRHAGQRAAARLHGLDVVGFIRDRGVLGLVDALRRRRTRGS
jgi:hypothetical protein